VSCAPTLSQRILGAVSSVILRLLIRTWRVSLHGPEPNAQPGPFVFCFWHGGQAGLLAHPRVRPAVVMTSYSRDGALQSAILSRLGFSIARGSSSRGGAAGLKAVVKKLRDGHDALFAVDGPRGPLHVVKPGAVAAARTAQVSLVPLRAEASRAWVFSRAWDRYTLPKPFARVDIYRGEPVSPDEDDARIFTSLRSVLSPSAGTGARPT